MYFSSCKIPEYQESAYLTVLNKVLPYTGYIMTRCMQKGFIASYICLCDNSHICCLWPEKDRIWSLGTTENIKCAAWTLHRFSAMTLNHSLLYEDAANDMKRTFLIVWSKILDGRSRPYFKIELYTLHTQTIQSSQLDWLYFFHCGNDFWRIYIDFGVKIWPVKVNLRVKLVATGGFVSIYNEYISESEFQTQQTGCPGFPFQVYKTNKIHMPLVIYEPFNASILII